MSTVTVSFDVPERASGLVAVGQAVAATTDALAGQTFPARSPPSTTASIRRPARLSVEATLPNDANVLKPGMALTVAMSFPGEPHPSVPSLAVQWDRTGAYVWKVDAGSAHRVAVQILGRRSGTVIVTGDLAENDPVVVEGLQRLREGSKVTEDGAGPMAPARGGREHIAPRRRPAASARAVAEAAAMAPARAAGHVARRAVERAARWQKERGQSRTPAAAAALPRSSFAGRCWPSSSIC